MLYFIDKDDHIVIGGVMLKKLYSLLNKESKAKPSKQNELKLNTVFINMDMFMKNAEKELSLLESVIKSHLEKKKTHESLPKFIEKWLQLRNVINMFYVCQSFERRAAFYIDHPIETVRRDEKKELPKALTSESALVPIEYKQFSLHDPSDYKIVQMDSAYKIKKGYSPAETIVKLLFSRTALDCLASVQIANYLTILDLSKLIYGNKEGILKFDELFCAKNEDQHDFNRLRIGTMGNCYTGEDYSQFTPLFFFNQMTKDDATLENIVKDPEKFLGSKVAIGGDLDYLTKFPDGSGQGWNAMFIGLSQNKAPMFFAATGVKSILSYEEILHLLSSEFNEFPEFKNRKYSQLMSSDAKPPHLMGKRIFFDMEKIMLFVTDFKATKTHLKKYCDECYKEVRLFGYEAIPDLSDQKGKTGLFAEKKDKLIQRSKDDSELLPVVKNPAKKNPYI
jgi:hypothetical protein